MAVFVKVLLNGAQECAAVLRDAHMVCGLISRETPIHARGMPHGHDMAARAVFAPFIVDGEARCLNALHELMVYIVKALANSPAAVENLFQVALAAVSIRDQQRTQRIIRLGYIAACPANLDKPCSAHEVATGIRQLQPKAIGSLDQLQ